VGEFLVAVPSLGDHDKKKKGVNERLERLEKRLDALMRKLEGKGLDIPHHPRLPDVLPVPPIPDVIPAPAPDLQHFYTTHSPWADCETVVRAYKVPEGKLEALTALMARSDVPILISPGKGRIEVTATEAQHGIFKAFIDLIGGCEETQVQAYSLSKGKLEALNELMVRQDVPVLVEPGKKDIKVHGNALQQAVFKAFVDMIKPSAEGGEPWPAPTAEFIFRGDAPMGFPEHAVKKAKKKYLKETKKRKETKRIKRERRRTDRESRQHQRQIQRAQREVLRQRSTPGGLPGMLEQAYEVMGEAEARDLKERLEGLAQGRRLEELFKNASEIAAGLDSSTLEDTARVLEAQARLLEANAEALEQKARALEQQADALNDQAEEIERQAEEAEEKAEQLEERAEELEEEADDLDLESHSANMEYESASLLANASALDSESDLLDNEVESLMDEAMSFEDQATDLERKAEALAKLADMIFDLVGGVEERLSLAAEM
jgi:hypothetical protein